MHESGIVNLIGEKSRFKSLGKHSQIVKLLQTALIMKLLQTSHTPPTAVAVHLQALVQHHHHQQN